MDVDALLKDKKTWVVAGGAALVGLVVFLKRGSSTPAATSTAAGTPATGQMVTADTTSTDIASYLSQVSQQQQDQLNQWGANLTDTLKAIQAAGTSATGNSGATVLPTPANHFGGYVEKGGGIFAVPVGGGTNWANLDNTLRSVGLNGDIQTLLNLNPGLMGDVSNFKDNGGTWQNVFKNPITLNVPKL